MRRVGAAIFTAVTAVFVALPASAQEYPPVDVGPVIEEPGPAVEVGVREGVREGLAVTGADLALWVGVGLALLVAGLLVLRLRRRAAQA